jgi:hypothetical protein
VRAAVAVALLIRPLELVVQAAAVQAGPLAEAVQQELRIRAVAVAVRREVELLLV